MDTVTAAVIRAPEGPAMSEPMRALSIQQPWLGAIVLSDKRTENRDSRRHPGEP